MVRSEYKKANAFTFFNYRIFLERQVIMPSYRAYAAAVDMEDEERPEWDWLKKKKTIID